MSHRNLGRDLLKTVIESIKEKGQPEAPPKQEGRNMNLIVAPN